jgi:hypothetical protein
LEPAASVTSIGFDSMPSALSELVNSTETRLLITTPTWQTSVAERQGNSVCGAGADGAGGGAGWAWAAGREAGG